MRSLRRRSFGSVVADSSRLFRSDARARKSSATASRLSVMTLPFRMPLVGKQRLTGPRESPLAHQRLELRLLADRVEVGVVGCELAELVRLLDCRPQVLERIVLPPREALDARHVVEQRRILGVVREQLTPPVRCLGVLARLVEPVQ